MDHDEVLKDWGQDWKPNFCVPGEVTLYIRYTLIDNCIHRILSEQYLKMSRNKKIKTLFIFILQHLKTGTASCYFLCVDSVEGICIQRLSSLLLPLLLLLIYHYIIIIGSCCFPCVDFVEGICIQRSRQEQRMTVY